MADFLPFSQSHLSNQFLTCEDGSELISLTTWASARNLHRRCIYSTISQMIAASRKRVGHLKHSIVAMTGLREKQAQLGVPQHCLIGSRRFDTLENSTYMLDWLAEQHIAIYAVIHDVTITKPQHQSLDLKDTQWNLLSRMVNVLKPLQMATTVFSSDLNMSCSVIYPVINVLLSNHLAETEDDLPSVKNSKKTVAKELSQRFIPHSTNTAKSFPVHCAAVDPRYSQLHFLNEEHKEIVQKEIISQMTLMHTKDNQTDKEPPPDSDAL